MDVLAQLTFVINVPQDMLKSEKNAQMNVLKDSILTTNLIHANIVEKDVKFVQV